MKKKKITIDLDFSQHDSLRKAIWKEKVADMADGRRQRATTFKNRKKESNRKACRGKVQW